MTAQEYPAICDHAFCFTKFTDDPVPLRLASWSPTTPTMFFRVRPVPPGAVRLSSCDGENHEESRSQMSCGPGENGSAGMCDQLRERDVVRPKTFTDFADQMEAALRNQKRKPESRSVLKMLWRHVRWFWNVQKDFRGSPEEALFARRKIAEYGKLVTAYRRCIKAIDYAIAKADIALGERELIDLENRELIDLETLEPSRAEDWRFQAEKFRDITEEQRRHRQEFLGVWLLHIHPSVMTENEKTQLNDWGGPIADEETKEIALIHYMWHILDESLKRYPPDNATRRYWIICCASAIAGYATSCEAIKAALRRRMKRKLP